MSPEATDRPQTLARLRAALARNQAQPTTADALPVLPQPLAPLLGLAWRAGGLAEFVGAQPSGLMLAAALAARAGNGTVLVVDPAGQVSAAGLAGLGIPLDRLLFVRPGATGRLTTNQSRGTGGNAALWATEQALRCNGLTATLALLDRLDTTAARRLKLAAEAGGGLGLLVRSGLPREPPFADVRLIVRPVRSEASETLRPRLELEAVYQRNGREGVRCLVEFTADARLVSVASQLARPAAARRGGRADDPARRRA